MVLSRDTSSCSCVFVASPLFDAVPALLLLLLLLLLLCAERWYACAWRRCVSCCALCERRSVAGLCCRIRSQGPVGCLVVLFGGSLARGVVRE
jgi:hypothetical protein